MKLRFLACVAASLLSLSAAGQFATGQSAIGQAPLGAIEFQWSGGEQKGFQTKTVPEIDRYDTLAINVDKTRFLTEAGAKLSKDSTVESNVESNVEIELRVLAGLFKNLGAYHTALLNTVASLTQQNLANPDSQRQLADVMPLDTELASAGKDLSKGLKDLKVLKTIDPQLYAAVEQAFGTGSAYVSAARTIENRLNQLAAQLQTNAATSGALGMTATIVPPDAPARALHLPNYDQNLVASAPAVPNYIPVIDDRTRREIRAAEEFRDAAKSLTQVTAQFQVSVKQLQTSLDSLRKGLKTDVLEAGLTALIDEVKASARTDLGDVIRDATAVRDLVRQLNAATLTLEGSSDADRLLNLATSLTEMAQMLTDIRTTLPGGLAKLAADTEAALKNSVDTALTKAQTMIKQAASDFLAKQTFFRELAGNLIAIGQLLEADSRLALSAENVAATARALDSSTDYGTTLDLRTIAGDVHVRDHIVVQAGFYRRDPAGTLTQVALDSQSFVIQRYSIFPDSVRGGLLFVQPRSKIERDISYQPVPALGYYWRSGIKGHPTWNALGPSFGLTLALLDFKDNSDMELGIAGGISLLRDLAWIGYGRNLQARANYFYVGTNPLLLVKLFQNR
jgi:hypothetical protein